MPASDEVSRRAHIAERSGLLERVRYVEDLLFPERWADHLHAHRQTIHESTRHRETGESEEAGWTDETDHAVDGDHRLVVDECEFLPDRVCTAAQRRSDKDVDALEDLLDVPPERAADLLCLQVLD